MHVEYDTNSNFSQPKSANTATLNNQTTDYTAHVKLEGLNPDTLYYYRAWFSTPPLFQANKTISLTSNTLTGSFRTSPDPSLSSNKPISFIFAADLGGQKHMFSALAVITCCNDRSSLRNTIDRLYTGYSIKKKEEYATQRS